jgi:hypothetical protein
MLDCGGQENEHEPLVLLKKQAKTDVLTQQTSKMEPWCDSDHQKTPVALS